MIAFVITDARYSLIIHIGRVSEAIAAEIAFEKAAYKRYKDLGAGYTARDDKAHSDVGQDHYHFYRHGKQLFALNVDGSAHDKSPGEEIPKRIWDTVQTVFPELQLPPSRKIASGCKAPLYAMKRVEFLKTGSVKEDEYWVITLPPDDTVAVEP